jgi:small subunit ribosomal protein S10e
MLAEGVLWAPKDHSLPVHPGIEGVKNLYVIKAMQSFESKEYVTSRYAWRNLYWFLTDAGIEYLREYLNIPAEVVPATLMKSTRCANPRISCFYSPQKLCLLHSFNTSAKPC